MEHSAVGHPCGLLSMRRAPLPASPASGPAGRPCNPSQGDACHLANTEGDEYLDDGAGGGPEAVTALAGRRAEDRRDGQEKTDGPLVAGTSP
jgi:hypothetical protein